MVSTRIVVVALVAIVASTFTAEEGNAALLRATESNSLDNSIDNMLEDLETEYQEAADQVAQDEAEEEFASALEEADEEFAMELEEDEYANDEDEDSRFGKRSPFAKRTSSSPKGTSSFAKRPSSGMSSSMRSKLARAQAATRLKAALAAHKARAKSRMMSKVTTAAGAEAKKLSPLERLRQRMAGGKVSTSSSSQSISPFAKAMAQANMKHSAARADAKASTEE